jgi:hypothetical protein
MGLPEIGNSLLSTSRLGISTGDGLKNMASVPEEAVLGRQQRAALAALVLRPSSVRQQSSMPRPRKITVMQN